MHGLIGGSAFPRNNTPHNANNIKIPVLRLRGPQSTGPSEPPNPKWKGPWQLWRGDPQRQNETGAANFLSPPPYNAEDGGTPQFDRGGWVDKKFLVNPDRRVDGIDPGFAQLFKPIESAKSTWDGPVAGSVSPAVKGKIGEDKSHGRLVRDAETASHAWADRVGGA